MRAVKDRNTKNDDNAKAAINDTAGNEDVATAETETFTEDQEDKELFDERAQ